MTSRTLFRPLFAALWCAGLAASAWAADPYPSRPIKVIVPYPGGGVVDVQTRVLTQTMAEILKSPVVVEPKPGASGSIAAESVVHADPDGYTLMVSASFINTQPLLESNLRWSTQQLTPVGRFALSTSYFVVPMSSKAKTLKEFAEIARAAKPPLQYANLGEGTPQTMSNELFRVAAHIPLEPVRYKGAPPAVPDLINGLVSITVLPSSVAIPQIKGGKLRVLANAAGRRSVQLPDVPSMTEAGYPSAAVESWYGLHAPAGTPPEVIRVLEEAMRKATATPEFKQRMINASGEEAFQGTKDFTAFLAKDAEQWTKAVKAIAR